MYRDEFEALLGNHFPTFRLWGQKLAFQSLIWSLAGAGETMFHQEGEGGVSSASSPGQEAVYLLALCAANNASLPDVDQAVSLFDDEAQSVYHHYHHEIRKNMAAGGLLQERDREISELKARLTATTRSSSPWWKRLLGRD